MTSKRLLEQPRAGDSTHEGGCAGQREPVIGKALHEVAVRNFGKEISPNGHYYTSTRERHYIHKKVSDAFAYVHLFAFRQFAAFINKSKRLSAVIRWQLGFSIKTHVCMEKLQFNLIVAVILSSTRR